MLYMFAFKTVHIMRWRANACVAHLFRHTCAFARVLFVNFFSSDLWQGWQTVFTESTGNTGSDAPRLLNYPTFSTAVSGKPYGVRLSWSSSWVQFLVPAGYNIFDQSNFDQNIVIGSMTFSTDITVLGSQASSGFFCHACVNGKTRWGDTCWGVLPSTDTNRQCGCSSGGWAGPGLCIL